MNEQKLNPDILNKVILTILTACLSIIAFFLVQVFITIKTLSIDVKRIQIDLAKIQVETSHYVTKEEMIEYHNSHR